MKSEKGITLTSLVLYIMLVLIVLGILAVITASFQSNLKEVNKEGTKNSEVDSFNMCFLQEVKKQGNKISTISENEILFTTGNKFSFRGNMIYLNDNIKIAENIENCAFSDSLENGKTIITVTIKARDAEERSIEYVLNSDEILSNYDDENNYISVNEIGYKQVEYLQSTKTQWIDTGVQSSSDLKIVIDTMAIGDGSSFNDDPLLGGRTNDGKNSILICFYDTNNHWTFVRWGSGIGSGANIMFGKFYPNIRRKIEISQQGVYMDGNMHVSVQESSFQDNGYGLALFGFRNLTTGEIISYGRHIIYSCQIYKDNLLIRDFIPVLDKDGIACLYDKVEDKCYYNQGTGDFIAGPEI